MDIYTHSHPPFMCVPISPCIPILHSSWRFINPLLKCIDNLQIKDFHRYYLSERRKERRCVGFFAPLGWKAAYLFIYLSFLSIFASIYLCMHPLIYPCLIGYFLFVKHFVFYFSAFPFFSFLLNQELDCFLNTCRKLKNDSWQL